MRSSLRRGLGRLGRGVVQAIWPNQRLRLTREGSWYLAAWMLMVVMGFYHNNNFVMLVAALAFGPVVSSVFASASMLRCLTVSRRPPVSAVHEGGRLTIEYALDNSKWIAAAIALTLDEELQPEDKTLPRVRRVPIRAFWEHVPAGRRGRARWNGTAPGRGRYRFRSLEIMTAHPFGLLERRVSISMPAQLVVYPAVGVLTRRGRRLQREASESRRGQRQERSIQQLDYHGLREYRPGDSPRSIHWRTTARIGVPMVKEFEVQRQQDLAILVDPWLPRHHADAEHREAVERAIQFAATVIVEVCRDPGRRVALGWTGTAPGARHGLTSPRLMHECLENLAVLKSHPEGKPADLIELLPPSTLREAFFVIVTTRPLTVADLAPTSNGCSPWWTRGFAQRAIILNAARGDLDDYIQFSETAAKLDGLPAAPAHNPSTPPPPSWPAQPSTLPTPASVSPTPPDLPPASPAQPGAAA